MKNHAADPEIGFLTKSILKPYSRATAMPPAWELNYNFRFIRWHLVAREVIADVVAFYTKKPKKNAHMEKTQGLFIL